MSDNFTMKTGKKERAITEIESIKNGQMLKTERKNMRN
jgi:hypothetical protein